MACSGIAALRAGSVLTTVDEHARTERFINETVDIWEHVHTHLTGHV